MHQGQMAGLPQPLNGYPTADQGDSSTALAIDELIANATAPKDTVSAAAEPAEAPALAKEKKSKKDKDKPSKLVYSDNEVSPEEKMARLSRYAFATGGSMVASAV
jgi:hypothetical protein